MEKLTYQKNVVARCNIKRKDFIGIWIWVNFMSGRFFRESLWLGMLSWVCIKLELSSQNDESSCDMFHQPSSRITNYIFFFFCSRFFKLIHAHTFSNYSSFNPPSFHSICAISTFISTYSILSLYLSIFLPKYLGHWQR